MLRKQNSGFYKLQSTDNLEVDVEENFSESDPLYSPGKSKKKSDNKVKQLFPEKAVWPFLKDKANGKFGFKKQGNKRTFSPSFSRLWFIAIFTIIIVMLLLSTRMTKMQLFSIEIAEAIDSKDKCIDDCTSKFYYKREGSRYNPSMISMICNRHCNEKTRTQSLSIPDPRHGIISDTQTELHASKNSGQMVRESETSFSSLKKKSDLNTNQTSGKRIWEVPTPSPSIKNKMKSKDAAINTVVVERKDQTGQSNFKTLKNMPGTTSQKVDYSDKAEEQRVKPDQFKLIDEKPTTATIKIASKVELTESLSQQNNNNDEKDTISFSNSTGKKVIQDNFNGKNVSSLTTSELEKDNSIFLWLSSDMNVETTETGVVKKWTDRSQTQPKHVFLPVSEESHFSELHGHESHKTKNGEPLLQTEKDLNYLQTVAFPCALESKGSQLPQETPLTLFFLLRPAELNLGVTAVGQRFFGHYPNGQFRFFFSSPSLYSRGDNLVRHFKKESITSKEEHHLDSEYFILKYRIDSNGIQIGVNHDDFYHVSSDQPEFSKNGKLTVGGVNSGCGFNGNIAEILVFKKALSDESSRRVVNYLSEKWFATAELKSHHPVEKSSIQETKVLEQDQMKPNSDMFLGNDLCKDHASISKFEQELPYTEGLSIWLRADVGIELEHGDNQKVSSWTGQFPGDPVQFFSPADAKKRLRKPAGHAKLTKKPRLEYQHIPGGCLPVLSFSCGIISENHSLKKDMTIFIVMQTKESSAIESRIMGHFPNGGLLMFNGKPMFKTKSGHLGIKSLPRDHKGKEEFILLKYRFGFSGIEVGVNGGSFAKVGSENDLVFSSNGKLTIGGTNGECGFDGVIGEVIMFSEVLSNQAVFKIFEYLNKKWALTGRIENETMSQELMNRSPSTQKCYPGQYSGLDRIFSWVPHVKLGIKYSNEVSEWQKLIIGQQRQFHNKDFNIRSARLFLKEERLRIFGPPCAEDLPSSKEQTYSQKTIKLGQNSEVKHERSKESKADCPKREYTNKILDWKAPKSAPKDLKYEWEDKVEEMKKKISNFQMGGDQLQSMLKGVVHDMNQLRNKLFKSICDETEDKKKSTKTEEVQTKKKSILDCQSKKRSPIEWTPPENAPEALKVQWNKLIEEIRKSITSFNEGGASLVKFLRQTERKVDKERDTLFGELCDYKF